jgi:tripartite-type tricarboxylate transporter receptor subunit TctC
MTTTRPPSRRTVLIGTAAAGIAAPAIVRAQAKFPTQPIRIISAFPPGGLTDGFARAYGEYIGDKLGQTVIVENKPGAGGATAAMAMRSAPADGHTLFITISSTILGNRVLFKSLPYDPDKDFAFISMMPSGHLPLVVRADTGVKTLKEFGEWAKDKTVSGGSFSAGSYAHMAIDLLQKAWGINFPIVQYRGEAPMWNDFAAGVIHIATGSYQAAQAVLQSGAGRAIAVPTLKRMRALPDVQTFHEQGFTQRLFQLTGWICLLGPAGMPNDVAETLSKLCVDAGKTDRVRKLLDTFGIDDAAMDRQTLKKFYDEEGPVWIEHARALNLTAQ